MLERQTKKTWCCTYWNRNGFTWTCRGIKAQRIKKPKRNGCCDIFQFNEMYLSNCNKRAKQQLFFGLKKETFFLHHHNFLCFVVFEKRAEPNQIRLFRIIHQAIDDIFSAILSKRILFPHYYYYSICKCQKKNIEHNCFHIIKTHTSITIPSTICTTCSM